MLRISIVTATRNRPVLLRRTIEMVQAQSLFDWEMQIVDDGDGSALEVAASFGDPRIHAQRNTGQGQVDARNMAIGAAQGEYIHLLDDDDRWQDVRHLELVVNRLEQQPALWVRGGWLVLEDLETLSELERREFNPIVTAQTLRRDNTVLTSGAAYPRVFHEQLGLFDNAMGNYWDWDWWLRASSVHGVQQIFSPCVLISWRGNNTSADPGAPSRRAFLDALCKKHVLGAIESKNHATVL
ncbi:MAG: glycosyltransferase family 2 protein [Deinococcales bacterium]